MAKPSSYFSHGKLLISGEYVVMDGAKALAIPTKMGQRMKVRESDELQSQIYWKSFLEDGKDWFSTDFNYHSPKAEKTSAEEKLVKLFQHPLVKEKLQDKNITFRVETTLDFPKDWGLGTSSTFINNVAQWLDINPYILQQDLFGGSGYDIACANISEPITFQKLVDKNIVKVETIHPVISTSLFFVYLNKKQNSREAIQQYKKAKPTQKKVNSITEITDKMLQAETSKEFAECVQQHNFILANILKTPSAQEVFKDSPYTVKYLGAWGGDFMMVISDENPQKYFNKIGFPTVLSYKQLFN